MFATATWSALAGSHPGDRHPGPHPASPVLPHAPPRLGDSHPGALFSGGSLLQGTVGRTDLLGDLLTRDLARAQWTSARHLGALDDETRLHPTHGFGSFCASGPAAPDSDDATIGAARGQPGAPVDREPFVEELVAGFGPVPTYYEHMGPLNRAGAGAGSPDPPAPAHRSGDRRGAAGGAAGSSTCAAAPRTTWPARLPGSVSIPYGDQFATWIGLAGAVGSPTLVPELARSVADLDDPVRDLHRIGIEDIGTHVLGAALPARPAACTGA